MVVLQTSRFPLSMRFPLVVASSLSLTWKHEAADKTGHGDVDKPTIASLAKAKRKSLTGKRENPTFGPDAREL